MKQLCPFKIDCIGSDSPLANLSSETIEGVYWRAIGYCCDGSLRQYYSLVSWDDALDGLEREMYLTCPPCPPMIEKYYCDTVPCADLSADVTKCSMISQADAHFQAEAAALELPCPPDIPEIPCNDVQICESVSDEGVYTYIVFDCKIYAPSVIEANRIAYARACERAREQRIRLGALTRCTCANVLYSSTLKITTDEPVLNVFVSAGALPTGLTLHGGVTTSKEILLDGIPTEPGTYTFSIRAVDANGNYATREYSIVVIEITSTQLPELTIGTAYSYQLTATGGSGNYQWGISSGSLPAGLTLSITGLISGTPTATSTDPITFVVVDLDCEELEASAIKPAISMTAVSQSRYMTWLGWQAFNGEKRRFKKLEWTGESEQWATTMWDLSTDIARAKYVWEGASEITAAGVQISQYRKNFYQRYPQSTYLNWPYCLFPGTEYDIVTGTEGSVYTGRIENLKGYCYSVDPKSPGTCLASGETGFSYDASNNSPWDWSDFLNGTMNYTRTATSFKVEVPATGFISEVGWELQQLEDLLWHPEAFTGYPTYTIAPWTRPYMWLRASHDYEGILSEEYTDAEAYANAYVLNSNATTAENNPRLLTSGDSLDWWRAKLTSVDYTLHCSNLVVGRSYTVEVSLISSTGTITKPTVTFTAAATTHTISGSIPTPPNYHTTMVRYPKISFTA